MHTPATRSAPAPALHSLTLRHVISPALAAVGGQNTDAAGAAADVVDALAVLESTTPGACVAFVGQLMTAAVSAPIAGGGELEQLRRLAGKLGEAVQRGMQPLHGVSLHSVTYGRTTRHCDTCMYTHRGVCLRA